LVGKKKLRMKNPLRKPKPGEGPSPVEMSSYQGGSLGTKGFLVQGLGEQENFLKRDQRYGKRVPGEKKIFTGGYGKKNLETGNFTRRTQASKKRPRKIKHLTAKAAEISLGEVRKTSIWGYREKKERQGGVNMPEAVKTGGGLKELESLVLVLFVG